jgi:hypothetical protein
LSGLLRTRSEIFTLLYFTLDNEARSTNAKPQGCGAQKKGATLPGKGARRIGALRNALIYIIFIKNHSLLSTLKNTNYENNKNYFIGRRP